MCNAIPRPCQPTQKSVWCTCSGHPPGRTRCMYESISPRQCVPEHACVPENTLMCTGTCMVCWQYAPCLSRGYVVQYHIPDNQTKMVCSGTCMSCTCTLRSCTLRSCTCTLRSCIHMYTYVRRGYVMQYHIPVNQPKVPSLCGPTHHLAM